jgi:GMP synthase (glutamine-hydrolysing)
MTLLLDCYLDDFGCPPAFAPPGPHTHIRAAHVGLDEVPRTVGDFSAIVISGSAASVLDEEPWSLAIEALIADAYAKKVPLFGVCYGHQLIAKTLFGAAVRAETPEVGWFDIRVNATGRAPSSPLASLPESFRCFLSHYDEVRDPGAANFEVLASSKACCVQAFRLTDAPIFGVQFHAEFSRDEALTLFDIRAEKTPEAIGNVPAMRALAGDGLPLWAPLYQGFLERG